MNYIPCCLLFIISQLDLESGCCTNITLSARLVCLGFDYQGSNIPATDPWPPLTFSPVECTSFPVKNITSSNDGRTDNY